MSQIAIPRFFSCDSRNYIHNWLIAGPSVKPYAGPPRPEGELRIDSFDLGMVTPPDRIAPGAESPLGHWHYVSPGQNSFVEQSTFYFELSLVDMYAACDVESEFEQTLDATLWASGCADLFVNGEHIARHNVGRYMQPLAADVSLPLKAGRNRLFVRLQVFGVRDTRHLFGLQVSDAAKASGLRIFLPAPSEYTASIANAEAWLAGLTSAEGKVLSNSTPPAPAFVSEVGGETRPWPFDVAEFDPDSARKFNIEIELDDAEISRHMELPDHVTFAKSAARNREERRNECLRQLASAANTKDAVTCELMARHLLGEVKDTDTETIATFCDRIDGRPDCADFTLSMLLRLYHWKTTTAAQRERIRQTALTFRYWRDEPGSDAMCFDSENHSLLFHGCQRVAGLLFPNDIFTNSGRTGSQQAEIGRQRCLDWFGRIKPVGFNEFLSSTYMPITVAALLNLFDYSEDSELATEAAALTDRILRTFAEHCFDGVVTSPQGRVYRGVLTPETDGAQALLSFVQPEAIAAKHGWMIFPASSKYHAPSDLLQLMNASLSKRYREGDAQIVLHKTDTYCLSSVQLPAPFSVPSGFLELIAGRPGYQQHLWHATLGAGCHIFVNHPGCFYDLSSARPGYWYGNGSMPWQKQDAGVLAQIFDIPSDHYVSFTHAHWPADVFDTEHVDRHWAFGAKGEGCIALWCSSPLSRHNDVLCGRELRASGRKVAWIAFCGSLADFNGADNSEKLAEFAAACRMRNPVFDEDRRTLRVDGSMFIE